MNLLPKTKKGNADKILDGDESGLFYIDERARRQQERPHTHALEEIALVKRTYEQVTGEKISTYQDFQEMVNDCATYWRKNKAKSNISAKRPMTLQLIEEGFDIEFLEEQLKLPEGFNEVIDECGRLLRQKYDWNNYAFDGEKITLSTRLINRLIGKVYFHAPKKIQKRRFELANKFKALIPEWIELLKLECDEMGIHPSKVEKAIASKRFLGPLVYCLKLDQDPFRESEAGENIDVTANPDFVINGHKRYADQIGLPGLNPGPEAYRKQWVDNTLYRRVWRVDSDGARRPYYVIKGFEQSATAGYGPTADIKFDKWDFVIRDGKYVLAENE